MTPEGKDCYYGEPDLFAPMYDEAHISTVFTWDIKKAYSLVNAWRAKAITIRVGGPAFDDPGAEFISGRYLKKGVTITSRGCPNNCYFCFVPKREGKIRELPIVSGNIIQDNNLLACSKTHIACVFSMLKGQRHIDFSGGFEASRITDEIVEQLRGLRIYQIWLAYDMPGQNKALIRAVERLKKFFSRAKIRCYVLIGYKGDTIERAEKRLKEVFIIGTLPFAMLYRDEKNTPHSKEWKRFQRLWTRPAIIKTRMK